MLNLNHVFCFCSDVSQDTVEALFVDNECVMYGENAPERIKKYLGAMAQHQINFRYAKYSIVRSAEGLVAWRENPIFSTEEPSLTLL